MAIKTSDINLDYFKIKDNLHQTFKNPNFSFRSVANVDIARKMQDGKISRDVVELIKFVFRFALQHTIKFLVVLEKKFQKKQLKNLFV